MQWIIFKYFWSDWKTACNSIKYLHRIESCQVCKNHSHPNPKYEMERNIETNVCKHINTLHTHTQKRGRERKKREHLHISEQSKRWKKRALNHIRLVFTFHFICALMRIKHIWMAYALKERPLLFCWLLFLRRIN